MTGESVRFAFLVVLIAAVLYRTRPAMRVARRGITRHQLVVALNESEARLRTGAVETVRDGCAIALYGDAQINAVIHDVCEDCINAAFEARGMSEDRLRDMLNAEARQRAEAMEAVTVALSAIAVNVAAELAELKRVRLALLREVVR